MDLKCAVFDCNERVPDGWLFCPAHEKVFPRHMRGDQSVKATGHIKDPRRAFLEALPERLRAIYGLMGYADTETDGYNALEALIKEAEKVKE